LEREIEEAERDKRVTEAFANKLAIGKLILETVIEKVSERRPLTNRSDLRSGKSVEFKSPVKQPSRVDR